MRDSMEGRLDVTGPILTLNLKFEMLSRHLIMDILHCKHLYDRNYRYDPPPWVSSGGSNSANKLSAVIFKITSSDDQQSEVRKQVAHHHGMLVL